MSLDVVVESTAPEMKDVMVYANGHFDFALLPENFSAEVFDMWAVNLISAIATEVDKDEGSKVNCIVVRLGLETGMLTEKFSKSYEALTKKKKLVSYLEGGFGSANVPAEPPLSFGSHRSKLVEQILKAPCKSKITRNEFIRIVTWIDANAPYYGTHEGKKNIKWKDDPKFRPFPVAGK